MRDTDHAKAIYQWLVILALWTCLLGGAQWLRTDAIQAQVETQGAQIQQLIDTAASSPGEGP